MDHPTCLGGDIDPIFFLLCIQRIKRTPKEKKLISKLEKEVVEAYGKTNIDLEALFKGEDPFKDDSEKIADEVDKGLNQ